MALRMMMMRRRSLGLGRLSGQLLPTFAPPSSSMLLHSHATSFGQLLLLLLLLSFYY